MANPASSSCSQIKLMLADQSATRLLAQEIGKNIESGALLSLHGQLGAGKTFFVKALAKSLGVEELVTSPTFVLMNEYFSGRLPVYHLDLYRLREGHRDSDRSRAISAREPIDFSGAEENLNTLEFLKAELSELMQRPNVVVIEWAEFLDPQETPVEKTFLHQYERVQIYFEHVNKNDSARIADIKGCGEGPSELVNKLIEKFGAIMICS